MRVLTDNTVIVLADIPLGLGISPIKERTGFLAMMWLVHLGKVDPQLKADLNLLGPGNYPELSAVDRLADEGEEDNHYGSEAHHKQCRLPGDKGKHDGGGQRADCQH